MRRSIPLGIQTQDLSIEIGQEVKPIMMDFVVQSIASTSNTAREWTYRKDGSS
jgi:hypothetical protein